MRTALIVAVVLGLLQPVAAGAQPACSFHLAFKAIHERIALAVGRCLEDEHFDPSSGTAVQRTAAHDGWAGFLVWRKADNWTAFTDGHWTWVNGPYGLQRRLKDDRLAWEAAADPPVAPAPRPCAVGDLNLVWAGSLGATGGNMSGIVAAGNRTATPCVLRGMPTLELVGADGRPLGARAEPCVPPPVAAFRCDFDAPVLLAPGLGVVVPHHLVEGQALLRLAWTIHDGAGFCPSPPQPVGPAVAVRLTLRPGAEPVTLAVPHESGGYSEADILGRAACGYRGTVTYGPFWPMPPRHP